MSLPGVSANAGETGAIVLLCMVLYKVVDHFMARNSKTGPGSPPCMDHGLKLAKLEALFSGFEVALEDIKKELRDIRMMIGGKSL